LRKVLNGGLLYDGNSLLVPLDSIDAIPLVGKGLSGIDVMTVIDDTGRVNLVSASDLLKLRTSNLVRDFSGTQPPGDKESRALWLELKLRTSSDPVATAKALLHYVVEIQDSARKQTVEKRHASREAWGRIKFRIFDPSILASLVPHAKELEVEQRF